MKKRTAVLSRGSEGTPNLFHRNSGTFSCQGSASLFRYIGDTDNLAESDSHLNGGVLESGRLSR
jgi:hypothetical protein